MKTFVTIATGFAILIVLNFILLIISSGRAPNDVKKNVKKKRFRNLLKLNRKLDNENQI